MQHHRNINLSSQYIFLTKSPLVLADPAAEGRTRALSQPLAQRSSTDPVVGVSNEFR